MSVATEQNAEIVEPGNVSLKLYSIDQEDRDGRFALAHGIQESVLQVLLFVGHGETALFRWLQPRLRRSHLNCICQQSPSVRSVGVSGCSHPVRRNEFGGVTVKFMEASCDRPGLAIADWMAIDLDHRQCTDGGRCDKRLARSLRLRNGETPFND